MKILFWILTILSLIAGLFVSVVGYFAEGLGLYSSMIGKIFCMAGILSVAVSVVCAVLGIIKLRKGNVKKAVVLALVGLVYSGVMIGGMFLDDAVDTVRMENDTADRKDEMYGENWDSAPAIEGIPELYVEVLNEIYAIAKDELDGDLMNFGVVAMPNYYGRAPLDNIGFTIMDVNGDNVNELVIGTAAPVESGGTAIFCIYSDPENPFSSVSSIEGETYYLHSGEAEGSYLAEIDGRDAAWELIALEGESIVDINYVEGAMDPAGRLTLEMIPFSQYK